MVEKSINSNSKRSLKVTMSKNIVCHICDSNLAYKDYPGTKLLDEFGNKPCWDCFQEDEVTQEEIKEENKEETEEDFKDGSEEEIEEATQ